MSWKKRTAGSTKTQGEAAAVVGRRGPFGNILQDDPYTAQIQGLLRKAKSENEEDARTALLELFHRFHLRLPLEEERLRFSLPSKRLASQN